MAVVAGGIWLAAFVLVRPRVVGGLVALDVLRDGSHPGLVGEGLVPLGGGLQILVALEAIGWLHATGYLVLGELSVISTWQATHCMSECTLVA